MKYRSDKQIHDDVLVELNWDMRVDDTDVGVEVDNGVVTLTGTVPSYAKSMAAEDAAHRVDGVLDVANDIHVKVPGVGAPTDTEIAKAVRDALQWNVFVDDEHVKSTVHDGFVTLEGMLDTLLARDEAGKAVRALKGVRGLINHVRIAPAVLHPNEVRAAIGNALRRRAENAVHGVKIAVKDNEVVLEGRIPTWAEKQTIVDAASHVRGINRIVDHMLISPIADSHMAV